MIYILEREPSFPRAVSRASMVNVRGNFRRLRKLCRNITIRSDMERLRSQGLSREKSMGDELDTDLFIFSVGVST